MGQIVTLCMLIAICLAYILYSYENPLIIERAKDKPFKKEWANKLYELSYSIPFIWFIDEKEKSPKTKEIKQNLFYSGMTEYFNYRSFTTFKVILLILSIILFLIANIVIDNISVVTKVLFNIENIDIVAGNSNTIKNIKIYTGMILLVMNLLPNIYIRQKANLYKYYQIKDLPIIQLFIILMLRSKRPLSDIIFALSKLNTKYKEVFDTGYRIYIRDKKEGLSYIGKYFENTKFKETVNILNGLDEYSKEDSVKLLENNLADIIEDNKNIQRKRDISKVVLSQLSLVLPFVSIILLGFIPLVMLGISIFQKSNNIFIK